MRALMFLPLLALFACGADGAPTPPAKKTTGIAITGEATMGLAQNGTK